MTRKTQFLTWILTFLALGITVCGAAMMGHAQNVKRPASTEFGLGPRSSAQGTYTATIDTTDKFKARKMYTVRVTIADANGKSIDNADITVGGGMPEHGHGLPTQPRVTNSLGNGSYEISGLRFNMGGWWELKLTITTPAGTDTVTFNLSV